MIGGLERSWAPLEFAALPAHWQLATSTTTEGGHKPAFRREPALPARTACLANLPGQSAGTICRVGIAGRCNTAYV